MHRLSTVVRPSGRRGQSKALDGKAAKRTVLRGGSV